MLDVDEVYRRHQQMLQAVINSFESVAGLGNAAPYENLANKKTTKHFRSLNKTIIDQLIQISNKGKAAQGNKDASMYPSVYRGQYSQRPMHNSELLDHQPLCRPQRGLPEPAVTVLGLGYFNTSCTLILLISEKMMLAKQTGLPRRFQVGLSMKE